MFTLILLAFAIFCAYKVFFSANDEATENTTTKENDNMGIIRDTAKQFRNDIAPVKEQVTQATTNARQNFEDAKHQRRIDALMNDPRLLADALEARASKQGQLPTSE